MNAGKRIWPQGITMIEEIRNKLKEIFAQRGKRVRLRGACFMTFFIAHGPTQTGREIFGVAGLCERSRCEQEIVVSDSCIRITSWNLGSLGLCAIRCKPKCGNSHGYSIVEILRHQFGKNPDYFGGEPSCFVAKRSRIGARSPCRGFVYLVWMSHFGKAAKKKSSNKRLSVETWSLLSIV
jgi:hypothetical protein